MDFKRFFVFRGAILGLFCENGPECPALRTGSFPKKGNPLSGYAD
jgi:hypothetical protein